MMAIAIRYTGKLQEALQIFEEVKSRTEGSKEKSDPFYIKMRAQHGIYLFEDN